MWILHLFKLKSDRSVFQQDNWISLSVIFSQNIFHNETSNLKHYIINSISLTGYLTNNMLLKYNLKFQ